MRRGDWRPKSDPLTVVCPLCSREQTLEGPLARSAVTLGRFTCEQCNRSVIAVPKPRTPGQQPQGTGSRDGP